jgi:hypothetical protein
MKSILQIQLILSKNAFPFCVVRVVSGDNLHKPIHPSGANLIAPTLGLARPLLLDFRVFQTGQQSPGQTGAVFGRQEYRRFSQILDRRNHSLVSFSRTIVIAGRKNKPGPGRRGRKNRLRMAR